MTGSLQIKNGKYYAVLNFKSSDNKRKQKWINTNLTICGNKRKAETVLHKLLAKYEGFSNIQSDILFCDYILKWLEYSKNHLENTTFEGYKNSVENHIYPYFLSKKIKLCDIDARQISEYYRYKISQGLSSSTIRRHHANIRKCLQDAMIDDIIPTNPADKVRLPKTVKYAAKFYDTSQIKALLDCAVGTDIEPIVILSVCYGLRRSEVLGLKWSAIDFVENKIQIDYTITRINTQCEKPRTKNLSSNRTLPLIPYAKNYLKHLKDIQSANAKLFGNCYTQNDFVCKKIDGKPFRTDEVSHKFSRLLKKNGLPHIRLHDLRHSCASMLIAEGVDIKVIQEWLGHSSIATTGNIYGHLQFKQKVSTGNVIENLLRS